jgi:hypothetical protein
MSDTSTETRPRSARTAIAVLLVLAALCLGGFLVWQNYGRLTDPTAGVQPEVQSRTSPRAQPSDEKKPALNAIEQTVKDLQISQQQTADQLGEIKRDLAAEQGERKMLSEQVGALAGRVDSLAASSVAPGASGNTSAKKKR